MPRTKLSVPDVAEVAPGRAQLQVARLDAVGGPPPEGRRVYGLQGEREARPRKPRRTS